MTSDQAAERLREWFPKGSTVYTIIRHVSSSGTSRVIGLVSIRPADNGTIVIRHPNFAAAEVLGWKMDKTRDGIRVSGCGMDMAFHLVYELSSALYGDGYALKKESL